MFDALQTLIDSDILTQSELRTFCDKIIVSESADDSDKKRAALIAWEIENQNTTEPDSVTQSRHDENTFDIGRAEYLVLTDEESDEFCADRIKDSLWAFNADFLAGETGFDSDIFKALSEKCESGNDSVLQLVEKSCGFDEFAKSAASADGRGHFLSGYDGAENEYAVKDSAGEYVRFYIFRVN